jgi:hypothetical protein
LTVARRWQQDLSTPTTGNHPGGPVNRFLRIVSIFTLSIAPAACLGADGAGSSGQLLRCVTSETGVACEPTGDDGTPPDGPPPEGTCIDVDDDSDGSPDDDDDDDRDGDGRSCDDDDDDDGDGLPDDDDDDDDDDGVDDQYDCDSDDDDDDQDDDDDTCDDHGDDSACPGV